MVTNIDGRPTLVTLPLTTQTLADKMLSLAFHLGYQVSVNSTPPPCFFTSRAALLSAAQAIG